MSTDPNGLILKAVKTLRLALGETQQSFAGRLGLAISTVVRYESTRPPRGAEIARFLDLAIANGRQDLAEVFARAMADELELKAERIPRTIEENVYADLLFLLMRNRGHAETDANFRKLSKALLGGFAFVASRLRAGEAVFGITAEDVETLEGEVRALKHRVSKGRSA